MYSTPVDLSFSYLRSAVEASLDIKKVQVEPNSNLPDAVFILLRRFQQHSRHTVRTVAADLRRGEHIPKMQNNIGRKSMLRVLRQLRSKDGGAGCRIVPCRAGPRRAALGLALRSPQLP